MEPSVPATEEPKIFIWNLTSMTLSVAFFELGWIIVGVIYTIFSNFSLTNIFFGLVMVALFAGACFATYQAIRIRQDYRWLLPLIILNCFYMVLLMLGLLFDILGMVTAGITIVVASIINILLWVAFTFIVFRCYNFMKGN